MAPLLIQETKDHLLMKGKVIHYDKQLLAGQISNHTGLSSSIQTVSHIKMNRKVIVSSIG